MKIAIGLVCLVVVAALEGVIGFQEQQLLLQNQIQDNFGDLIGRKGEDCQTKKACQIAGGKCQSKEDECDGDLREGNMYCKNNKNCGCCIPPGCVHDMKAYPDNSMMRSGCLLAHCNKGTWAYDMGGCSDLTLCDDLSANCPNKTTPCDCAINTGFGCILGAPTTPNHACRCTLTGPLHSPKTTCTGVVVKCTNPALPSCKLPGTTFENCMQGTVGSLGNCCGYPQAECQALENIRECDNPVCYAEWGAKCTAKLAWTCIFVSPATCAAKIATCVFEHCCA